LLPNVFFTFPIKTVFASSVPKAANRFPQYREQQQVPVISIMRPFRRLFPNVYYFIRLLTNYINVFSASQKHTIRSFLRHIMSGKDHSFSVASPCSQLYSMPSGSPNNLFFRLMQLFFSTASGGTLRRTIHPHPRLTLWPFGFFHSVNSDHLLPIFFCHFFDDKRHVSHRRRKKAAPLATECRSGPSIFQRYHELYP
jgi:hypothetical protein